MSVDLPWTLGKDPHRYEFAIFLRLTEHLHLTPELNDGLLFIYAPPY